MSWILVSYFGPGALWTLAQAVMAAPLLPVLILYGGGALMTLLFLRYVVFAPVFTERRRERRRARKPRLRLYPTVQQVAP
jgi:hypothetical protein